MADGVFHEGELAIQTLAGEREIAERNGQLVDDTILVPALPFLARQSLLAAAAADDDGRMWCSVWCGAPGFVTSADAITLAIARDRTSADDPVRCLLRSGSALGLVVIELGTRKRLRINGTVAAIDLAGLRLVVRESFPNCPKYIQKRRLVEDGSAVRAGAPEHGIALDAARIDFVRRTDTMFVGSRHPTRGPDASHRGGDPGFLRVLDEHTIRVPDYPGNGMFQTLGNLHVDPRAGLVLVDFEARRLLAMTGATTLFAGLDDPAQPNGGSGRYWDFAVHAWRELDLPAAFTWALVERSPHNPRPATGAG